MPPTDQVAELTFGQLADVIAQLQELTGKLIAEYHGQAGAWTERDALLGHQALVFAHSHVTGARALHAAAARRGTLVRLDDRR